MTLFQDLRYALRTAWRDRAFSLIAVTTLALGIGANTALFTIVHAILLAPLPFRTPEQLVRVTADFNRQAVKDAGLSVPELFDLQQSGVFDEIGGVWPISANLTETDEPERVETALVEAELLHDARHRRAARTRVRRLRQAAGDHRGRRDQRRALEAPVRRRSGRARQADPHRQRHVLDHRRRAGGVPPSGARHRDRCRGVGAGRLGGVAVPDAADPSRVSAAGRPWPSEAGRQRRRGTAEDRCAGRAAAARVSRRLSRRHGLGAARNPAARRPGRQRPAGAPDAARRRRLRAADCVRQRRQPAARAIVGAAARDCRPPRARRGARAPGAAALDRERAARGGRRRARPVRRGLGRGRPGAAQPLEPAAAARRRRQLDGARVHHGALAVHRHPLRARAGDPGIARRSASGDPRGGALGDRRRPHHAPAQHAGRRRVRARAGAARRRRAPGPELLAAAARRPRLQSGVRADRAAVAAAAQPARDRAIFRARRTRPVLHARARSHRRAAGRRRPSAASPACRSPARPGAARSRSRDGRPRAATSR